MARFPLRHGRWIELRPPSAAAVLFIDGFLDDQGSFSMPKSDLPEMLTHLRRATLNVSWPEGDASEMTLDEIGELISPWYVSGEDDALPPESAATSPSLPAPEPSAARTGRRGRSGGPSASTSSISATS